LIGGALLYLEHFWFVTEGGIDGEQFTYFGGRCAPMDGEHRASGSTDN